MRKRWRARVGLILLVASLALVAVAVPSAGASPGAGGFGVYLPLILNACSTVPSAPSGWTTVWSDDFAGAAGSAPSAASWLFDSGTAYPGGPPTWGTGEVETDTSDPANLRLDGGGHLLIVPVKANGTWTSARIETRRADFAAPPGGKLEVTACIEQPNPPNGPGYWPAFWMLGAAYRGVYSNWPGIGEIDVMEDVNALGEHSGTLHCGTDPGGPCDEPLGLTSGFQGCADCQTGYHVYTVIVDRTNPSAEEIRWYLDGAEYFRVSESQVGTAAWQAAVDHGFFLILDVAMGGSYPDGTCGCTTPADTTISGAAMGVSYVAVYQSGP